MIANFWSPRSTLSPEGRDRGSGLSVSSLSSDDNDFASEKEEVAFLRREVEALRAAAADRAAPVERPRGASPAPDGKRREARAGRRRAPAGAGRYARASRTPCLAASRRAGTPPRPCVLLRGREGGPRAVRSKLL